MTMHIKGMKNEHDNYYYVNFVEIVNNSFSILLKSEFMITSSHNYAGKTTFLCLLSNKKEYLAGKINYIFAYLYGFLVNNVKMPMCIEILILTIIE